MKMKKISAILLVTILVFTFCFNVLAKPNNTKLPFEYKINPESSEWTKYEPLELKKLLDVPMEEVENLDTESLLNIVLDYPFLGDIYAFNDPTKAIDFLAEQFNGLKVLLKREDLKDKLIKSYIDSSDKIIKLDGKEKLQKEDRFEHKYRESLFSYPTIYNKLNKEEKDTIKLNSKKVSDKIDTNPIEVEQAAKFKSKEDNTPLLASAGDIKKLNLKLPSFLVAAAGDVLSSGFVLTPKLSSVTVYNLQDMTAADKTTNDAYMASRYPNATKLRTATWNYNCHSYAWYSISTSNTWWMNDPSKYMTDGSYTKSTTAASGQKIYYPNPGNEHSGIISSVNGYNITVTSKWGSYGLYSHDSSYCPYISIYQSTYWK